MEKELKKVLGRVTALENEKTGLQTPQAPATVSSAN